MLITRTPLRISFLGGNTDFPAYFKKYGGAVLTTAIDKYVYCIVTKRFDNEIRVNYSIKEKVDKVSEIKHGLVREAMRLVGVDKGIEITFLSDVPSEGSGLGSSSSVTVGVLNALHHYLGEQVNAKQLAEEACKIEIDILKKPIGMQDQYIVAFGGFNLIIFGEKITLDPVCPPGYLGSDFEDSLLLLYTGKTRKADQVLSQMRPNKKILDINKYLTFEGLNFLKAGDIFAFGEIMDVYWSRKKELNKAVTNRSIDRVYKKAMDMGAWGGKICGAGGGGYLLLVIPGGGKKMFIEKLGLRQLPVSLGASGSEVIFNNE